MSKILSNTNLYVSSIFLSNADNASVTLDTSKDFATGSNPLTMPSIGDFFGDINDLGYVSTISEELYNLSNYSINTKYGVDYWKMDNLIVANEIYEYFTGDPKGLLSNGNGLIVKDAGKDSKLTFFVSYVSENGEYDGYTTFTYYDLGSTSHKVIEDYLKTI